MGSQETVMRAEGVVDQIVQKSKSPEKHFDSAFPCKYVVNTC